MPAKYGVSGQKGANNYYDKSIIYLPRQHMSHPLKPLILQAILSSRDDFTKVLLKNVGISSTNLEVNKKSRTLLVVNYN